MPLGAVVTKAAANDGQQTHDLLKALVLQPPAAKVPVEQIDPRDLPTVRADGAYGNGRPANGPSRRASGWRLPAGAKPSGLASAWFVVPWNGVMRCSLSSVALSDGTTAATGSISDGFRWPPASSSSEQVSSRSS